MAASNLQVDDALAITVEENAGTLANDTVQI